LLAESGRSRLLSKFQLAGQQLGVWLLYATMDDSHLLIGRQRSASHEFEKSM
jgi:hypothetical protein